MSKKYLSLEEAARMLSMAPEELVRLREKGDVRGFADRGTWKFKHEDIESLLRRRQADSNPEVPLMDDVTSSSLPVTPLTSDDKTDESDLGEQPTIIRKDRTPDSDKNLLSGNDEDAASGSDSDVRLVGGPDLDLEITSDSDSDVKLVGLGEAMMDNVGTDPDMPILPSDSTIAPSSGSDSDVKLVRSDSDSDVKLVGDNSDSDVKLVGDTSDSDVKLVGGSTDVEMDQPGKTPEESTDHDQEQAASALQQSDSDINLQADDSSKLIGDVALMDDDDDAVAIDFNTDEGHHASVLDDESGISLGRDSSLLLGESGISLAGPNDSGIALDLSDDDDGLTLAMDDESGISLDAGESGISLESADSGITLESGESGISLEEDDDSHGGTVPMMDIFDEDDDGSTQFDVPSAEDDSGFDTLADDATGVMDLNGEDSVNDAVFDLDEDEEVVADGVSDVYGASDVDLDADSFEEEDLDVFDADEGAFETSGIAAYSGSPSGRLRGAETEWDTVTFVGLTIGSLLLVVCGLVMVDLVKNTATAATPNPVTGQVIEILSGLYK